MRSCVHRSTRRGADRLRDDIARITQELADEFEGLIAAEPQQWHLLQPNWPSDHASAVGRVATSSVMRVVMVCPYSLTSRPVGCRARCSG